VFGGILGGRGSIHLANYGESSREKKKRLSGFVEPPPNPKKKSRKGSSTTGGGGRGVKNATGGEENTKALKKRIHLLTECPRVKASLGASTSRKKMPRKSYGKVGGVKAKMLALSREGSSGNHCNWYRGTKVESGKIRNLVEEKKEGSWENTSLQGTRGK